MQDELDCGAAGVLSSGIPLDIIHHIHLPRLDTFARSSCAQVKFILPGNRPLWRNDNWQYKIRTTILPKLLEQENIFPWNPVEPTELECIIYHFDLINVLNMSHRRGGPCTYSYNT